MPQESVKSFTDLNTWQQSHKLAVALFLICEPMQKRDALRDQMERAVVSITSNIAEGFGRQSVPDKKHFYIMARGSAYELQNQLLLARDIRKISEEDFQKLAKLSLDSIRLLHGLIRSLKGTTNS